MQRERKKERKKKERKEERKRAIAETRIGTRRLGPLGEWTA